MKEIFIKLDIKDNFDIPKLHVMMHYIESIKAKGTVDGYNTKLPEQLHINLTKELYQATNKKNHMQQMVKILHWLESLDAFIAFMKWVIVEDKKKHGLTSNKESNSNADEEEDGYINDKHEELEAIESSQLRHVKIFLPKDFSFKNILVKSIEQNFGALNFIDCLSDFLKSVLPHNEYIQPRDTNKFNVYRCCKIIHNSLQEFGDEPEKDVIQATPSKFLQKTWRNQGGGHFDTALVDMNGKAREIGMEGITVIQIQIIFKIPIQLGNFLHPLVYVEFFSGTQVLTTNTRMYQVHWAYRGSKKMQPLSNWIIYKVDVILYQSLGQILRAHGMLRTYGRNVIISLLIHISLCTFFRCYQSLYY